MRPALVVIPCGRRKRDVPTPAGDLYCGGYFVSCRRAALALDAPNGYLILSAKYGLLRPTQVIPPYDMHMGDRGCVTPGQVIQQARAMGVRNLRPVVVFGGVEYVNVARAVWPHAITPLKGKLGPQRGQLRQIAERGAL